MQGKIEVELCFYNPEGQKVEQGSFSAKWRDKMPQCARGYEVEIGDLHTWEDYKLLTPELKYQDRCMSVFAVFTVWGTRYWWLSYLLQEAYSSHTHDTLTAIASTSCVPKPLCFPQELPDSNKVFSLVCSGACAQWVGVQEAKCATMLSSDATVWSKRFSVASTWSSELKMCEVHVYFLSGCSSKTLVF